MFLDLDDVLCINSPYGGYDVFAPDHPVDLWERLFHQPAVDTLLQIINEYRPLIVLTTSWLRFMDREGFEDLFRRTGLAQVAASLHPSAWEAPQAQGTTRLEAIDAWLAAHRHGERFVILDDELSGTGLRDSPLAERGLVAFCEVGVGLTPSHLDAIRRALGR
ncbi:HAD domain-containing protein [Variovorax ginsengisoli]|uniref:HAD domain-containing protein n=1 Tax=Variovorax ginsengisoli TaxID=363844 RepID=A0ABT8S671_9BURK|nr:HAD domain-containing protein [Variovorax ginsengisoli]MDN8615247.1 HAD domain-containing protein [Variovorax ginsengisoli]MDO1534417.1 HAD domain-containing protein [Variovorax ginsengisoli]